MVKRHVYRQTIDALGDWMTEKDLTAWRSYLAEKLSDRLAEELPIGVTHQIGAIRDEAFDVFIWHRPEDGLCEDATIVESVFANMLCDWLHDSGNG